MNIFIILLLFLCLFGIKLNIRDDFVDYCSKDKTTSIKGIFVIIVFLSHLRQYIHLESNLHSFLYFDVLNFLGQLMVTLFLFYSGYGVALSLHKNPDYVKTFPKKRIFRVWYHFAAAVCAFELLSIIRKEPCGTKQFFLALTGWRSCGNSNWFIFDILVLYCVTYFCFIVFKKLRFELKCLMTTIFCVAFTFVMYNVGKDSWWYNTIMCYPLGMWFTLLKPVKDDYMSKNKAFRFFPLILEIVLIAILSNIYKSSGNELIFIVLSFAFVLAIINLTVFLSIGNVILQWFGNHVFSIYILQRIPMIILSDFGLNNKPVIFAFICLTITVVISQIFDYVCNFIDFKLKLIKKKPVFLGV